MITYTETIAVQLDGRPIGTIHIDEPAHVYYLPKGYKKDETTHIYVSVTSCKRALEAP